MSAPADDGETAQTTTRNVAPYTEVRTLRYEGIREAFMDPMQPQPWLGAAGARKRGARLRVRWGGRIGLVRPRGVLPTVEMREENYFRFKWVCILAAGSGPV